jgi:hypothetical protein
MRVPAFEDEGHAERHEQLELALGALRCLWRGLEQLQSPGQLGDGRLVRVVSHRLFPGLEQVGRGL